MLKESPEQDFSGMVFDRQHVVANESLVSTLDSLQ